MRVVVQRSLASHVSVASNCVGKIEHGLVLFVGFTEGDTKEDIDYLVQKIIHLRIFDDENGVMNKSILEVSGQILSISQFTLFADTKKGNRPSYRKALGGEGASSLYELFNQTLQRYVPVETGIFGADMQVSILNDGPVTILFDSKNCL